MLIVTATQSDSHAGAVAAQLTARSIPVWIWDLQAFPRTSPLSIHIQSCAPETSNAALRTSGRELPLEQVKSVWLRPGIATLFASPDPPEDVAVFMELELGAAFRGAADALRGARWVNPPDAVRPAESLIAQLQAAAGSGLQVPPTLITTECARVRDRLTAAGLESTEGKRWSPWILREIPPFEAEVQVLVAGRRVFAAERIPSESADVFQACALPPSVEEACLRLVHGWGLVLGAANFIRLPGGRHIFMGFCANPDWLGFDRVTGRAITAAVADLLDQGA